MAMYFQPTSTLVSIFCLHFLKNQSSVVYLIKYLNRSKRGTLQTQDEVPDNHSPEETNEALASEDAVIQDAMDVQGGRSGAIPVELTVASKEHHERAKKWTEILNGTIFQPNDLKAACIEAQIVDYKFKAMPRQNPKIRLRWWQVGDACARPGYLECR
ncbi:hypothetical protein K505DRAFT_334445 [Melanomma pulvis-pyrius CBS 109.77]|uniref:Uncharacterized protein n=1 Tax=Melanomma pulvis-pyrius CBS 109.77 TaxID=1314802 RepID=A0A6A6XM61_9PLEO|nr:hypothetical protein K505DRAFT_334445 [Melanomma pulvis-pyrius CBS 109.77]